jgi:YHS domain-containing protein
MGANPKNNIYPKEEMTMIRTFITSAIAGAFALGLATAAFAVTGEFDNMCSQGLAMGKQIKTDCSINGQVEGKTYCFGDETAKTEFMKDPKGNLAKAQATYSSIKKPG